MHELALLDDLLSHIDRIATEQRAIRVTAVKVRIGALAHISGEHLREHFVQATRGGIAENARLFIVEQTDQDAADAQDFVLDSLEVEVAENESPDADPHLSS